MKKIKYILLILSLFININVVKAATASEVEAVLNNLNSSIFLSGHPVGSIYETTSSDENTVAKMKSKYGGTWEVYGENKLLRGTTGTAGQTDGTSSVTLTTANLPEHDHSIPALSGTAASTGSGYTITYNTTGTNNATSDVNNVGHTHTYNQANANTGSTTLTINQIPSHDHKMAAYASGKEASGYGIGTLNGFSNRVMVEVGNNAANAAPTSDTGGGKGHTHTMPKTSTNTGGVSANHTHKYTNKYATGISGVGAHSHTVSTTASTTGKTGSGTSFSVLNPYITVYRYKRTA